VVNDSYQIKLKGYKTSTADGYLDYRGSLLNWSVSVNGKNNDTSVLEVDQSNGVVKAVGKAKDVIPLYAGNG